VNWGGLTGQAKKNSAGYRRFEIHLPPAVSLRTIGPWAADWGGARSRPTAVRRGASALGGKGESGADPACRRPCFLATDKERSPIKPQGQKSQLTGRDAKRGTEDLGTSTYRIPPDESSDAGIACLQ